MHKPAAARQADLLLQGFLEAEDDTSAQRNLGQIIDDHACPIVRSIIGRKLHVYLSSGLAGSLGWRPGQSQDELEAEDLEMAALYKIIERLRESRNNLTADPISDFRAYTAVTTYRIVGEYLRWRFPVWQQARDEIRYLLDNRTNQKGLARWRSNNGKFLCGFAAWQNGKNVAGRGLRCQELLSDPDPFVRQKLPYEDIPRMNPAALLAAIFQWVGEPVEIDTLVGIYIKLREMTNPEIGPLPGIGGSEDETHPLAEPAGADRTDRQALLRVTLQSAWKEILQLTPPQRAALLLNLRDDQDAPAIDHFLSIGISRADLAAAMGLSPQEFEELWKDLPLDDANIARRLGLPNPQKVINLRMVARKKLNRWLAAFEED